MWRNRLSGRRRETEGPSAIATAADVWERAGQAATATLPLMTEIEALALQIYGAHGLPTQAGHYRRGPTGDAWVFLGEHLDADLRWAMVLDMPPEAGWRYATLEDIGRYPGAPADLRAASGLLATCRRLKSRLNGREVGNPGDDIETAIRLGADWRALQDALAMRGKSRLKLTTPAEAEEAPDPQAALPAPKPRRLKAASAKAEPSRPAPRKRSKPG